MTPVVRIHLRSALALAAASVLGIVAFTWPFFVDPGSPVAESASHSTDAPWVFVLLVPLLAAIVLAQLTEGGMDAKAVAMLGMLASVGAALRALGPGAVGIEPSFFVVILGGRVFGRGFGFVLGALTIVAGALITGGVGPWMPFQMLACAWVGFLAGCLPQLRGRAEALLLAGFGLLAGLAYGLIINMWFWPFATVYADSALTFVPGDPLAENFGRYVVFWAATSLGWDVPRGVIMAVLFLTVGPSTLGALRRAARRAAFDAPVVFVASPARRGDVSAESPHTG